MSPIIVHLHTILQKQASTGPVNRLIISFSPGQTIERLRTELDINLEPDALLLVVNGQSVEPDRVLNDGDEVHFIPAISGGMVECLSKSKQ